MNEVSDEEKIKTRAKEYCSLLSECYKYFFDTDEIEEGAMYDIYNFLKDYREFVDNDDYIRSMEFAFKNPKINPEIRMAREEFLKCRGMQINPLKIKIFIYGNLIEWRNDGNLFLLILQIFLARFFVILNYDICIDNENCYIDCEDI